MPVKRLCELGMTVVGLYESQQAARVALDSHMSDAAPVSGALVPNGDKWAVLTKAASKYRYRIVQMGDSSDRYGACEVCGQHVPDVYYQVEERHYQHDAQDKSGWTHHQCASLFGHLDCLAAKQRGNSGNQ